MMRFSRNRQSGAAFIEFALVLAPLITLLFGVTEFGRAMYQYNTVAKSVRVGARFLSQYAPGDATTRSQAQCLTARGNTGCVGPFLVPGLTTALVIVNDSTDDPSLKLQPITANGVTVGTTNLVRVRVSNLQFQSVVSFIAPNFTFDPISVTMMQAIP